MKNHIFTLMATATLLVSAELTLNGPGHVYTDHERVNAGGDANAAWQLTDWRGRNDLSGIRTSGTFDAAGKADLGQLPTGYYHLKSGSSDATFAVVPRPESRVFDHNSFYGIDSAQSWVSRPGSFNCPWYDGDTYRLVSDLLQRSGLPHVRERLSSREVNPSPGKFDYKHYMYNADLLRDRHLLVSGMFHDAPKFWDPIEKLPRNLAALHDFCRHAAADFGDRMGDWEFWNEQDIGFAPEPVWDYTAALKAAYVGFKAGRPRMPVLHGALCQAHRNDYDQGLYANDAAKYSDVFNFHTYHPLVSYPSIFRDLRRFMEQHGIADRAVWMTESGTNLEGHSNQDGAKRGLKAHSPDQELVHAEFYAKSQIAFQMEGVARNYFFVFGAFNERDGVKDWGVMRRDGTVKPAYAAISTMTRELVSARLEGEVKIGEKFKAYLFTQPNGSQTLVFWSVSPVDTAHNGVKSTPDFAAELKLPIPVGSYTLSDLCGQRRQLRGNVVTATRFPSYISGLRGLKADVKPFPCGCPTPYRAAADEDLSVVFRVDLAPHDFTIMGSKTTAELRGDTGRLRVQIWNLSNQAKRGHAVVAGGSLSGLPDEIKLPPMGKSEFDCVYHAKNGAGFLETLVLSGVFNGKRTSRLAMPVRNVKAFLANCKPVELLNWRDPKAWRRNTSAQQFSATWDETEKAMRFDMEWTKPADRWFYPVYDLKLPEESFAGAVMFEFEVKSAQNKVENDFACQHLMLLAPGAGDRFLPYPAPLTSWEKRRVGISSCFPGDGLANVKTFRLGANPQGTKCTFWVRNPRLLKSR